VDWWLSARTWSGFQIIFTMRSRARNLRTEWLENLHPINARIGSSCSRYPAISLQSVEVGVTKRQSKSIAYENRTKSAKCGGLETSGPKENFGLRLGQRSAGVLPRKPAVIGLSSRSKAARRVLVAARLAEGEELASNILQFVEPHSVLSGPRLD
jgi:hypothetical protein